MGIEFYLRLKSEFPDMFENCISSSVGEGWKGMIYNLTELLNIKFPGKIKVLQFKEKFGGLRLVHQLIHATENLSFTVCENCGKVGKETNLQGWIKTLCEKCETEFKENPQRRL